MRNMIAKACGALAMASVMAAATGAFAQSSPATGTFGAPASPSMQNAGPGNSTQPGTVPSTMQVTPGVLPPDPTRQGVRDPYQQPSMGGTQQGDPRSSNRGGRRN